MARVLLIFNPVASRADPEVVRTVCAVLAREGWEVEVAGTTRPGDASELARQGVADGVDAVAVYGGDGTVMQAVRGIVGHDVPIGLIPGGTGNLLAGNLRLPRNPAAAARVVSRGVTRSIDLGRVERREGTQYFAVACGAGLDAVLMAGTDAVSKRRWGMAAYVGTLWRALSKLRVVAHQITVDDDIFHTDAATVLVANCGAIIPGVLRLKADIAPDDGYLDVIALNATTVSESVGVLARLFTGRTNGTSRIVWARGRQVTVESDERRPVELDGEISGSTPFTAEVVPRAMRVFVPKSG